MSKNTLFENISQENLTAFHQARDEMNQQQNDLLKEWVIAGLERKGLKKNTLQEMSDKDFQDFLKRDGNFHCFLT